MNTIIASRMLDISGVPPAIVIGLILLALWWLWQGISRKDKKTEPEAPKKIKDPVCSECEGMTCNFLGQFIKFESNLLSLLHKEEEKGLDNHYSIWRCPSCNRYYLRIWEVDWSSGQPQPRRNQFICDHGVAEYTASELLRLIALCPNPMTNDPENCKCKLHQWDSLYFIDFWMKSTSSIDRISTEDFATTQYMLELGTDAFGIPYRKRRKPPTNE